MATYGRIIGGIPHFLREQKDSQGTLEKIFTIYQNFNPQGTITVYRMNSYWHRHAQVYSERTFIHLDKHQKELGSNLSGPHH